MKRTWRYPRLVATYIHTYIARSVDNDMQQTTQSFHPERPPTRKLTPQDLGEIQAGYNWGSAHVVHTRELEGGGKGAAAAKGAPGHSLSNSNSNAGSRISASKGRSLTPKTAVVVAV